ncbi:MULTISPECIES: hypothetical protein [unclassified Streptomyces]|uniref:hypothetical protein n=1 Tax=unclassified Streptomyces TaxID=2593676 RepID=UPI0022540D08|nr:hypothetical protein [Streptomyces sp. NBC_00047]MCX5609828.1 hypothetical protein [Streptomyces sp. NBC_00047]
MGRTRTTRQCPPRAAFALCPVAAGPAAVGPHTTADAVAEVPETRRIALHGHG